MTRAHLTDAGPDIAAAAVYTTLCGRLVGEAAISPLPTCVTCIIRRGIISRVDHAKMCLVLKKPRSRAERLAGIVRRWSEQQGGAAPAASPSPAFDATPYTPANAVPDARGMTIAMRSIAGDDGGDRYGWPSAMVALREWYTVRAASLIGSSSRYGGAGGGSDDHTPSAVTRIERILPVERAVLAACANGRTFPGDADGNGAHHFAPRDVLRIVELVLAGKGYGDIADRVGGTERQVSVAWGGALGAVGSDLAGRVDPQGRPLVAPPRARAYHGSRDARNKGASMALPDGFDLEGRAQIAGALGISTATLGRWMQGDDPPPVAECKGSVIASRAALRAWLSSHVIERKRAGAA